MSELFRNDDQIDHQKMNLRFGCRFSDFKIQFDPNLFPLMIIKSCVDIQFGDCMFLLEFASSQGVLILTFGKLFEREKEIEKRSCYVRRVWI